jgi:hypothetical protein
MGSRDANREAVEAAHELDPVISLIGWIVVPVRRQGSRFPELTGYRRFMALRASGLAKSLRMAAAWLHCRETLGEVDTENWFFTT